MEGMLWKWTNYFSGWQARWFILDDGILSYYKSQDEVNNGCKGSIKMSACDVNVHATDSTRLDLIIPGEAHFYVKASTPQERQQWLVALGSAKACSNHTSLPSTPTSTTATDEEPLKIKKSELRLYCDLLMQQVHGVKCSVQDREQPDITMLNESTSLLSATCDTFIRTLDECILLARANLNASTLFELHSEGSSSMSPPPQKSSAAKANPWTQTSLRRTTSSESYKKSRPPSCSNSDGLSPIPSGISVRYIPSTRTSSSSQRGKVKRSVSRNLVETSPNGFTNNTSSSPPSSLTASFSNSQDAAIHPISSQGLMRVVGDLTEGVEEEEEPIFDDCDPGIETRLPTFLSGLNFSFLDIRLTTDLEVPTVSFLDACRSILPIFDKLNQTAFIPAKLDVAGNINKIHQKYVSSSESFVTLQKMVAYEITSGQCHLSSSATLALLWLTRSLQFIAVISEELVRGADDTLVILNEAYARTLMSYHGWVIRSAFSMAVKLAPSKDELFRLLAVDETHTAHPMFLKSLLLDIADHSAAMSAIVRLVHDFLVENNLNFPDQV